VERLNELQVPETMKDVKTRYTNITNPDNTDSDPRLFVLIVLIFIAFLFGMHWTDPSPPLGGKMYTILAGFFSILLLLTPLFALIDKRTSQRLCEKKGKEFLSDLRNKLVIETLGEAEEINLLIRLWNHLFAGQLIEADGKVEKLDRFRPVYDEIVRLHRLQQKNLERAKWCLQDQEFDGHDLPDLVDDVSRLQETVAALHQDMKLRRAADTEVAPEESRTTSLDRALADLEVTRDLRRAVGQKLHA